MMMFMSNEEKCVKLSDDYRNIVNQCLSLETNLLVAPTSYMQVGLSIVILLIAIATLIGNVPLLFQQDTILQAIIRLFSLSAIVVLAIYALFMSRKMNTIVGSINNLRMDLKKQCLNVLGKIKIEDLCYSDRELIEMYMTIAKRFK